MTKSIIIIGGGAAGIFAAIGAKTKETEVTILEKMPHLGTKLKICGGGRCNITHKVDDFDELIDYYPAGSKFLYSALSRFGPAELIDFFNSIGVETFTDRGGRIFPSFENAPRLVKALEDYLKALGVKIICNSEVVSLSNISETVGQAFRPAEKFTIKTKNGQTYSADKVILTTGGLSYPKTGSTGAGFDVAKKLGHTITPVRPSLVPLEVKEPWIKDLQGLTLKNVEAKVLAEDKTFAGSRPDVLRGAETRETASKFGDMLFTHYGLSGPIILYLSRQAVNLLAENKKVKISINLKPALSHEKLDARLKREFNEAPRKQFKNILANLLPQKMIPVFLSLLKIKPEAQCAQITAEDRKKIINLLINFEFTITKDRGFYEAEVTQGGVSLNEVNPKTLESKIIPGLYLAGEVLDVDGYIGGFNLQAAFSTGFIAGINAV